ncbi:MAG: SdpI family protein [Oscillospiraceae bacterium]|nr:SdpI family protein [Oscillospiraceae bacterium]
MKNKKYWLITSAITLVPILLGLLLWNKLPDRLPTHFGVDGAADGWSGKGFAVFGLPLMMLGFHIVIFFATRLDKQNRGHNEKVMNLVGLIFPVMSIVNSVIIYTQAMDLELNLSMLLFPMLGLLFIAVGNWLPKIKQNSTLGIKIKWTLYNEENWNRTHRFAGFVWVIGGVIFCLMGFVAEKALLFLLPLEVILLAVVPMVYSWNLARKQKREGTFTESQVNKDLKKHPVLMGVTTVLVTVILLGVGYIMFTGDIDYTVTDDKLTIDADFHSDLTVSLDTIDSMELCQGHPDGTRTWGFASARLLMGWFESDELGDYTRYTYTGCDSYILLTSGEDILMINAKTEADTQALYEELLEKIAD